MTEPTVTEVLLSGLRAQSARFPAELREIEVAIAALELRRAFSLISRLHEKGLWSPTADEAQALDDFWWEYGQ